MRGRGGVRREGDRERGADRGAERGPEVDVRVYRAWRRDAGLLAALRRCFTYGPGEDRATGYLYRGDGQPWPEPLAARGPALLYALDALDALAGVRFTICAFQAYRDGAGCGWHADTPFGAQAILSLGVTRTFGLRRDGAEQFMQVADGDLVFMPDGFQDDWEHCVPEEDAPGERCSLVFRVPASAR